MKWTTEIPQKEGHYYVKSTGYIHAKPFPMHCRKNKDGKYVLFGIGDSTPLETCFCMRSDTTIPMFLIGDCMDKHLSNVEATITISSSELEEARDKAESERVSAIFRELALGEKIGHLEQQIEDLADKNIYKGNSVQHWWAKATAYSDIVFAVCEAFRRLGYTGEMGDTSTLPDRLNAFVDEHLREVEKFHG